MSTKKFIFLLKSSFIQWYKNPIVILPSLFLLILLFLLSNLTSKITLFFTKDIEHIIWLIFSSLFYLAIISLFFAFLLSLCFDISKKNKTNFKKLFKKSIHVWHRNFINTLIIIIFGMIAFLFSVLIGKSLVYINVSLSIIAFLFVMFIFLAGGIIFLTFTNVFTITHDFSVLESIKASISLVKRIYPVVFLTIIAILLINYCLSKIFPDPIYEIIKSAFIVPCFAIILVRLVIENPLPNP